MNKFLFPVLKDSVLRSPFVPAKKLASNPIAEAAGSVVGSILGFFGNERTNAANLQIARETNQQNKDLFHEQLDYQTGMWNKANEYNSPINQSKRLAAAGINPAAVLGNGSAVSDVSSPSAPAAPEMVAPQMQNYDVGASLQQAFNTYINAKNVNAQTRLIDEQAASEHFKNEISFERWVMEQKERLADLNLKIQSYEFEKDKHPKDLKHIDSMIDVLVAQRDDILESVAFKRSSFLERLNSITIENKLNDQKIKESQAYVNLMSAQSKAALSSAGLSNAQTKRILSLLPFEQSIMSSQDFFATQEVGEYLTSGFRTKQDAQDFANTLLEAASIEQKTDIEKKNFANWYLRFVLPTLSAVGGAVTGAATAIVLRRCGLKVSKKANYSPKDNPYNDNYFNSPW